ncbi:MAG TPA: glycoside hydrolase family 3 N-terminal domain-containing protein [Nocardioides sp.]|nr:glycoside hydrolase family 3 N-terminal domain-containing protein [Nocardioides sp.]
MFVLQSLRGVVAALAAAALIGGAALSSAPPVTLAATTIDGEAEIHRVSRAEKVHARMSLAQRVGQLFMVGTPATSVSPLTRAQVGRFHVGNVMLTGRSYSGTRRPATVAAALQSRTTAAATAGVELLVSTDQEGGSVQALRGRGISQMPSALTQGSAERKRLQGSAGRWARQLRAAGVNMNLAPVLDTVPGPDVARRNAPIGAFDRQFGFDPARVGSHGTAFVRGMAAQGVVATIKHFPGLGRVRGNTDTTAGVTDRVTHRRDAYLAPFREAIDAGAPVVMMSTAYYPRMDRLHPAAFSRTIVHSLLRRDLGFRGVVVSDDLAHARQVSRWSHAARAVKFIRAGGDLVLTVDPGPLPAMYHGVLSRARSDESFRTKVDQAALRVLRLKQRQHLLGPSRSEQRHHTSTPTPTPTTPSRRRTSNQVVSQHGNVVHQLRALAQGRIHRSTPEAPLPD